jgi:CHAT domain-containing protein
MKQLILIPDGALGYLPFESLLLSRPEDQNFRTWPYLVQQHSSLYANSVAVWMQQRETAADGSANYLGFAPGFHSGVSSDSRAVLGPLKFNQKEVEEAAKLMKGEVLLGSAASERNLKQLDQRAYVLHFATHALADEKELMQSRLFFEEDSSSEEDGILYAQEIYGLRINSPLTVLSACQTGKGPLLRGEGVMSLARAFQYAGSQRVLTTLWQADDRAGSSLNQAFFKELADGVSVEEALQKARIQWLQQSDTYHSHPYFWSAYVMIGSGGKVEAGASSLLLWLGGVGILGIGLFGAGVWRRKKKA